MLHTISATSTSAPVRTALNGAVRGITTRPAVFQVKHKASRVAAANGETKPSADERAERNARPSVTQEGQTYDKSVKLEDVQNTPLEAVAATAKQFISDPIEQVKSFVEYGAGTVENIPETIRRLGEGVAEGPGTQPASRPDASSPAYKGTPTSKEGPREK